MPRKKTQRIELTLEEGDALLLRAESQALIPEDYAIIIWLIKSYFWLLREIAKKKIAINRLKKVFGIKTEKSSAILKEEVQPVKETPSLEPELPKQEEAKEKKRVKGHGKNGVDAYTGLEHIKVSHPTLKTGSVCPECEHSKLHIVKKPRKIVCLKAHPPITGHIYELQSLRCSTCGKVFNSPLPADVEPVKYNATVKSLLVLLKYGNGFAFNRLKEFMANFGIPLPTGTQWDIIEEAANLVSPVYSALKKLAAQADVIHVDDTTVKILSHIKEKKAGGSQKGTFTTGMVAFVGARPIALYMSGENHAGKNMDELLRWRAKNLDPPLQMCDGLSRNVPEVFKTILLNCLAHARRNYVDIFDAFMPECRFVLECLQKVYHNDALTKEEKMSPAKRLLFHQENSQAVMTELKTWLDKQLQDSLVEPNSSLGKAIKYMLKRWEALTGFLRIENAPLDNNAAERALKKAILNRKNAYFFKTEFGAYVGDIFISLIQTCVLSKINAFEYLTALQNNSAKVQKEPVKWLPWNYKENFAA